MMPGLDDLHDDDDDDGDDDEETSTAGPCPLLSRLPPELLIGIVCRLSYDDLLSMRRTSKRMFVLMATNEAPIVRHYLDHVVPPYLVKLYRSPAPTHLQFGFLARLAHRQRVCRRLAALIARHVTRFFCSVDGHEQLLTYETKMRDRMVPKLAIMYHHLEALRGLYIDRLTGPRTAIWRDKIDAKQWEREMLQDYDTTTLLQVAMISDVFLRSLHGQFWPPSYAGRLERCLRGWTRVKAREKSLAHIVLVGGLSELERVWRLERYDDRIRALDAWIDASRPSRFISRSTCFDRANRHRRTVAVAPSPSSVADRMSRHHRHHPIPRSNDPTFLPILPYIPPLWSIGSVPIRQELLARGAIHNIESIPDLSEFVHSIISPDDYEPSEASDDEIIHALESFRIPLPVWP